MEVDHGPAPELKATWKPVTVANVEFGVSLGSGAFGEVFKGKFEGSEVALKRFADESTFTDVGFNEACIMSQLDHPNIVRVYAVCSTGSPTFTVIELCRQGSLQRALVKSHDMKWKDAYQAAVGLAEGVAYLHGGCSPLGVIVHSDLKPANAMVSAGWHAKLADFGYAQLAHPSFGQLQGKGGTLCYLAPEMLKKKLSVAADVYALGMMLCSYVHT